MQVKSFSMTQEFSLSEQRSQEDLDLLERSTKKTKTDQNTPMMEALVVEASGVDLDAAQKEKQHDGDRFAGDKQRRSYKETLFGRKDNKEDEESDRAEREKEVSDDEGSDDEGDGDCPNIRFTKEEKAEMRKPWNQTLIIKVMGRKVGYNYLLNRIKSLWRPQAPMELMAINDDYFLVRFASVDDYKYAKYGGPWMVLDHYLIVKEWRPNFNPAADRTENVLVWIRFPDLPIEYYGEQYLMKIGKKVGIPIKIDDATSLTSRGRFARMCVEVDLTKPLLARYKLRRRVYKIEYEGIHMVCFNCGVYGHNAEKCKEKQTSEYQNGSNRDEPPEGGEEGNQSSGGRQQETEKETLIRPEICESFGPWMLAPGKSRRQNRSQSGEGTVAGNNGNNRITQKGKNQVKQAAREINPFGVLRRKTYGKITKWAKV